MVGVRGRKKGEYKGTEELSIVYPVRFTRSLLNDIKMMAKIREMSVSEYIRGVLERNFDDGK